VDRTVTFGTPSSGRSIGQWWNQDAKPQLTRVYGKLKSLISKANKVGDVLGQAVQPPAKQLAGKPFAVLVCEG
jgi:hypothetical protein